MGGFPASGGRSVFLRLIFVVASALNGKGGIPDAEVAALRSKKVTCLGQVMYHVMQVIVHEWDRMFVKYPLTLYLQ